MVKKDLIFEVKASNDDNRTIEGVFSTADVDRSGDPPIEQESWNLKNFKKNPVVLFAHDSRNIPIGKVTKLKLDEKGNLAGKIMFAVDEGVGIYGDLIKTVYNLYKGKFMRAFSVGFKLGEITDDKKGMKLVKNELLEISCVPVPANALALAKSKGLDLEALEKVDEIEETIDFKKDAESNEDSTDEGAEDTGDNNEEAEENTPEDDTGDTGDATDDEKSFNLIVNTELKEIKIEDQDGKELGKVNISNEVKNLLFKDKQVVTESSNEQKEKSPKKAIKTLNKIIRTLLTEKQKVRSN